MLLLFDAKIYFVVQVPMHDAVLTTAGLSFNRGAVEEWLRTLTSEVGAAQLACLRPNVVVSRLVQDLFGL